jgi:hypothetical protein
MTKGEPHEHKFVKAYIYDGPKTTAESDARKNQAGYYDKGPRWILLWACETCPHRQAYDLIHKKPGKEVNGKDR